MSHPVLIPVNGTEPPARGGLVAADGRPLTPVPPEPTPRSESPAEEPTADESPASDEDSQDDRPRQTAGPSKVRWLLITVVVLGALVIAAIGFTGSYSAVRDLAARKGFGAFAPYFPIGIDAGIVVLLALDLLLTWLRIAFPLLRQTAWLLTAATVAFNAAAAWPDALGVGMHAVIPVLFIVAVEAARHAVGRVADITADKHMEGVRLARWLLAFPSTFGLWRRMKLWELRSYETAVAIEQDWAVYREQLRARYGRNWRRTAPEQMRLPLRLARYGVPLAEAIDRTRPAPDAPEPGRIPSAPDAPASRPDAPHSAASRQGTGRTHRATGRTQKAATKPGAEKPNTDDVRRAELRSLAAVGKAPASIRQAAELLGCRQSKAKALMAAEGLLDPTTHGTPSNDRTTNQK
ncbi:Protein of unknown function [Streptomyces sp. WMMB 322]|nr:Protein of unknown function [Streptomyces sp. WMMB 322]